MDEADDPADENARIWRNSQRARLLAARLALPEAEFAAASAAITQILQTDLLPRLAPKALAGYWPIRREYDCRPALAHMIGQGARAALPAILGASEPLEFRRWLPDAAMEAGPMSIPQPAAIAAFTPDCILIPVLGFDAGNYRLGYGAGYYDRTLAAINPKPATIGVGFEFQRLDDIRPHEFDVPLDYVVTEKGLQTSP
jgi:5-formyltetrahydrofolate cyclo-ligase